MPDADQQFTQRFAEALGSALASIPAIVATVLIAMGTIAIFVMLHDHLWDPRLRLLANWEWDQCRLNHLVSADEEVGPRGPSTMQTLAQRLVVCEERTHKVCTDARDTEDVSATGLTKIRATVTRLHEKKTELRQRVDGNAKVLDSIDEVNERIGRDWHERQRDAASRALNGALTQVREDLGRRRDGCQEACARWAAVMQGLGFEPVATTGTPEPTPLEDKQTDASAVRTHFPELADELRWVRSLQGTVAHCQEEWAALVEHTREQLLPSIDARLDADSSDECKAALANCGIRVIAPSRGDVVDHERHEEVAKAPVSADCPHGHVVRTIERGWEWCDGNVVFRPAKVIVAVADEQPEETHRE